MRWYPPHGREIHNSLAAGRENSSTEAVLATLAKHYVEHHLPVPLMKRSTYIGGMASPFGPRDVAETTIIADLLSKPSSG
jgi:hypothetical protein